MYTGAYNMLEDAISEIHGSPLKDLKPKWLN